MTTLILDIYSPTPAALHRLDPRWKLVAITILAMTTVALETVPCVAVAFIGSILLVPLTGMGAHAYLVRLGRVMAIVALFAIWLPFLHPVEGPHWNIGPLAVSVHGVARAVVLLLKSATVLTLVLALLASSPLNFYLHAADALRVPALLVHLTLLTYRYLFVLADELGTLRIAVRLRGYRNRASLSSYRTVGHVAGTLLVRSVERADRVGQAMRCRGYAGTFCSMAVFRTGAADVLFLLMLATAAGSLFTWDLMSRGW
jgi:cobalt/nickel transport system permease protein